MTTPPLFIYGTLQHEDVRRAVLGHDGAQHQFVKAALTDHAIYHVAGTAYPMIMAEAGMLAPGLIWYGLTPADYARLDRFEGAHYQRHPVQVSRTDDGVSLSAEIYQPDHILPRGARWEFSSWCKTGLSQFLEKDFHLDGVRSPKLNKA